MHGEGDGCRCGSRLAISNSANSLILWEFDESVGQLGISNSSVDDRNKLFDECRFVFTASNSSIDLSFGQIDE